MLFENTVPLNMHLPFTTQPGSVIVETMAGNFTKRVWQPYRDLAQISRRDRGFVIKAETETWKFESETRDLTFPQR